MRSGSMISPNIRLEEILGRGATGSVWLARNVASGGALAVKVLDAAYERALGTVQREASIIGRIHSPHIVQIYDVGRIEPGNGFIVMERLRGEDLASLLERVGRLEPARAMAVLAQAARALVAAHRAGIVHRDVKPTNIFLVDNDGAPPLVKLLDFGIAKIRDSAEPTITPGDALVGTPSYMSPEQIENSSAVDASADLWSLAVVAYQCLTGTLPFRGDTVGARCYAITQGRYERPTSLAPDLPGAVDAWFVRAFAKVQADRFPSARELADSLAAALGLPPEAYPDPQLDAPADPTPRPTEPPLTVGAAAPTEVLGRTAVEQVDHDASVQDDADAAVSPPRPAARARRWWRPAIVGPAVLGLGALAFVLGRAALGAAPSAATRPSALPGTARFVPNGNVVPVTLRRGDEVETIEVTGNGAFAFARGPVPGSAFEVSTSDPGCWVRPVTSAEGAISLDLRCRVTRETRSRTGPSNPAQTQQLYSTTSATYEDVPLLDPIELDTDVPAAVLVTLSVPASGFLRTPTIEPSGTGLFALAVDGAIVEEAAHHPMSEGQAAPSSLVALVPVTPGHHVLRVRRRVDGLVTPSRFLHADTVDGVDMQKIFHATVLESLETFHDVSVSTIGPQAAPPPPGRLRSLQTTIRSQGVVLAGLHAPAFAAADPADERARRLQLFANEDRLDAAVAAGARLDRAASLLWIGPYPAGTSVTVNAGRGGAASGLLPRGARLFAATFDATSVPDPQILPGRVRAADATTVRAAQLRWHTPVPARLLVAASLARVYSSQDGGSGFVTLRRDGQEAARVFFQSQSAGAGHGVSMVAIVEAPAGTSTITLELESRLGDVFIGDDDGARSALSALPLR